LQRAGIGFRERLRRTKIKSQQEASSFALNFKSGWKRAVAARLHRVCGHGHILDEIAGQSAFRAASRRSKTRRWDIA